MRVFELFNLSDGMLEAQIAYNNSSYSDIEKLPIECYILYSVSRSKPFILSIATSSTKVYLSLYDEFMSRFANYTIRGHVAQSTTELKSIKSTIDSFSATYNTKTIMSTFRYNMSVNNGADALNESAKNLQFLNSIVQKYFNKVVALSDAMASMIESSDDLKTWTTERGYDITSATSNDTTIQSVSHPLDASDVSSGIVDDSSVNDYNGSYTASSTSRDTNLISQFKKLWNDWLDVKNLILNDCESWFVNVFSYGF